MAQKRISISKVLDDLYNRKDELEMEEIENVANIFGLRTETVLAWLHRNDPDKIE